MWEEGRGVCECGEGVFVSVGEGGVCECGREGGLMTGLT